ncbi:DinQ-like type I toxin DqlB [Escherichia coli]
MQNALIAVLELIRQFID